MIDYRAFRSGDGDYVAAVVNRYTLQFLEDKSVISFAGGLPDPSTFPIEELKNITVEVLENYGFEALQYMPTKGVSMYMRELLNYLYRNRGIKVSQDNVLITTGSQQAVDIIARAFVDEGDIVVVEEPTYIAALNAFRARKPRFIGVPIDDYGMKVNELEDKLKMLKSKGEKVKVLYTVSTAQNPAGVTLSIDRRKYLLELAEEYDFLLIEDDAYGLMIFDESTPTTPIYNLDKNGRVIYIGSLSKILAPGLRLGHVIAPKEVIDSLEPMKQIADLHTSSFNQYIAALALKKKIIEKNINKTKTLYKQKRNTMIETIENSFPRTTWYTKPIGGMFIWVKLNQEIDTELLLTKAYSKGVLYVPGKGFYHNENGKDTMRLNFTYPTINQIKQGIEILAKVIKEELNT
ncbi:MAG: PLP-dependent aminotransferase family protein [Ignisphaera sp.]|uniref:PLP-dependent aminotransferase family protein n=1 Tax=Ignisphaera aggregans TaxID=334771 RepID=A0A7C4NLU2_9CREN